MSCVSRPPVGQSATYPLLPARSSDNLVFALYGASVKALCSFQRPLKDGILSRALLLLRLGPAATATSVLIFAGFHSRLGIFPILADSPCTSLTRQWQVRWLPVQSRLSPTYSLPLAICSSPSQHSVRKLSSVTSVPSPIAHSTDSIHFHSVKIPRATRTRRTGQARTIAVPLPV
jgi:hypothetical protein